MFLLKLFQFSFQNKNLQQNHNKLKMNSNIGYDNQMFDYYYQDLFELHLYKEFTLGNYSLSQYLFLRILLCIME